MSDNSNGQVFKGALNLDHTGSYYVNEVYPEARRIFSRPYSSFHHANRSPRFEFEDALFDMGKDLVGEPFETSLDLEAYLPQNCATTPFWNHDRIGAFSGTADYQVWLQDRSPQAAAAINFITTTLRGIPSRSAASDNIYAGLRGPLLYFWQDEPMLDPRLALAEELFVTCKTDGSLRALSFNDEERLVKSLYWMARPENARRIGQMFLYSRLAQHFGETDPASFKFSNAVMGDIVGGHADEVVRKLQQNAARYFTEKTQSSVLPLLTTDLAKTSFIGRGLIILREKWEDAKFSAGFGHDIRNIRSLAETAPAIVSDFNRLYSGAWAAGKLCERGFIDGQSHAHNALPPAAVPA